ncbi:hypothetical protein [Thalassobellus suaedae]|uniref:Uncharacterized protein n=1 Tax=Thalassobellus suaedae TaxID=3074124 RepID=A0ABY9XX33_9FLAO|nr:hypothetical protein RHP51_07415 [Flavobacteriaceae bacterium HL-DH14]
MIDSYITKYLFLKNTISESIINLSLAVEALKFLEGKQNRSQQIPNDVILFIETIEMCESEILDERIFLPDNIKNKCDNFVNNSSIDNMDIDRAARYSYVKRFLIET